MITYVLPATFIWDEEQEILNLEEFWDAPPVS